MSRSGWKPVRLLSSSRPRSQTFGSAPRRAGNGPSALRGNPGLEDVSATSPLGGTVLLLALRESFGNPMGEVAAVWDVFDVAQSSSN